MSSVQNLFRQGGLQWMPDVDAVNAPEPALLRADNLVPDQTGALAVRSGSSKVYSDMGPAGDVHSLHTVELADGNTYKVMGVGDRVFINGVDIGVTFDGEGDIAIGDDAYQIFMARGLTRKKFDGVHTFDWGVDKPAGVVELTALASITLSAAECKTGESPELLMTEGTRSYVADYAAAASQASEITPAGGTSRAVATRLFTTDQNFFSISGADGSDTDLFDIYVKMEDPAAVDYVKIVFGATASSTEPFIGDRFEFKFDLSQSQSIDIKDLQSEGYDAYNSAVQAQLTPVDPTNISSVRTPAAVKAGIQAVGTQPSPKSGIRPDPNVWGHLSVTRGQFERFGSTAARGWDTIRGFQVVYQAKPGSVKKITITDAIFIGGGDRSLTGSFRCVVRSAHVTPQYIELSPPSAESEVINLNHQTVQIKIPATMVASLSPQVDQFWVYLFGGWLDTYYRFAVVGSQPQTGMTMEELTNPDGGNFGDEDERSRLTSHGFTMPNDIVGTADIVITLDKSELDALTENERLEAYQTGPVKNIVSIAGPWNNRMFTMDADGYVYPSSNRYPSGFNSIEVLDLTRYGDPLWMTKTASGMVVGMEKDVVFLAGSGDENADLTEIDLFPQPLNVGNPPIDKGFAVDGNSTIYRSSDGLMILTGTSLQGLPTAGTSLLWRGQDRYGVSALNTSTGRFRSVVDNLMYYMLAPEGTEESSNVIYRFSFPAAQWSRLVYPEVANFRSISKTPSGDLIAGDDAGNLWMLDRGTQDNLKDITIYLQTPQMDGGNPLVYKDAFDLQLHCLTGGDTGTISLTKDGLLAVISSYTFSTIESLVYRISIPEFGKFLKVQFIIEGSFNTFSLQRMNLTYRARPQHSMSLDTGYILPAEPGDIVWLQEVEFDGIVDEPIEMDFYRDDVLSYNVVVPATPDRRTTVVLPLPRGSKAKRPRIVFKALAGNGSGHVGFDCYGVRARIRSTGNQNGSPFITVYPVGQAS